MRISWFTSSKLIIPFVFLAQFLHSCGLIPEEPTSSVNCVSNCTGSAGSNTGIFLDSEVAGVTYTTSSGLSGTTNSSGQFSYSAGDTVSFSIGDVSLGSVTAAAVLTPVEVMGASGTADQKVVNLARLLQTLDSDGDPSNGIEITSSASNALQGKSLDFNVPVDTFTSDSTIAQIQTAVGKTLISATSALNHLHTTLNERSLSSKVSSDSQLQAMGGTLGSFSFTSTNTLVGAAKNGLQTQLESLGLSTVQVKAIIDGGKTKLSNDGLSESEDLSAVLQSFLSGSMSGIGEASLANDDLTTQTIGQTTSTVTGLIGKFEDQLTSTSRAARGANEKAAFETLLGQLLETAVEGLAQTGLSNDALDEGFGEVVGAMVSSLDEAQTDPAEVGSAVQAVTKKAVQKAASVPGMDTSAAIRATTMNAVKGLGNTKMSATDITATLSATVSTVIDSLDEIEGGESLDLSSLVGTVTSSSVEGLADLQNSFEGDSSFDVSQAVGQVTKGATKGAGVLAAADSSFDLAATIGGLSKDAASALGNLTADSDLISSLTQGIKGEIESGIDEINEENPDLGIDTDTIKQQASSGLDDGVAAIPASCSFDTSSIPGYGNTITAYLESNPAFSVGCESEIRSCSDGVLTGSYLHPNCTVQDPASCFLDGQPIQHQGSITAYAVDAVSFDAICESETRICYDGKLEGTYKFASCTVEEAPVCDVNGSTYDIGATITDPVGLLNDQQQCVEQTLTCAADQGGFTDTNNTLLTFESIEAMICDPYGGETQTCDVNGNTYDIGATITDPIGLLDDQQQCVEQTLTCAADQGGFTDTNNTLLTFESIEAMICDPYGSTTDGSMTDGGGGTTDGGSADGGTGEAPMTVTLRAYELDDSADPITNEEKQAGTFEQINDETIAERGWTITDTGSTYTVEVGVHCFSWSRSTQGHPEQDGLAENLNSHDHFNAADETSYVDGIYSWTEYGPEHSQAEIDATCEAGIEGVSKTANTDNYTADVTIYLKIDDGSGGTTGTDGEMINDGATEGESANPPPPQ